MTFFNSIVLETCLLGTEKLLYSFFNCPTVSQQSQRFTFSLCSVKMFGFCFKSSTRLCRSLLSWQQCSGFCSSNTTLSMCNTSVTQFSVAWIISSSFHFPYETLLFRATNFAGECPRLAKPVFTFSFIKLSS